MRLFALPVLLAACATPLDCTKPNSKAMFDECVRITNHEDAEKNRVLEARPRDPWAASAKEVAINVALGADPEDAEADTRLRDWVDARHLPDFHDEPMIEGGY